MEDDILYLDRPGGASLAYCYTPPKSGVKGTTLVFLPGYMSDMEGSKALALDAWAKGQGRAMLRLDYAGCGASGGAFESQSLTSWREDVLFLIDRVTSGSITLIGSSMGGWLMLLVALSRPMRIKNLVGIAAAPDFTDWGFTQEQKMTILRDGKLEESMEDDILYLDRPGGASLAYCYTPPKSGVKGTTLVFLPGYMSDMEGSKALALDAWAKGQGRAMLRLDYAGCGASGGAFESQSLTSWREDVLFLIDRVTSGSITLIGSSMGGWLMLLVALSRPMRIKNLVGIAAAPDFTDWGFTQEQKMTILRDGKLEEDSAYSDDPYVTTQIFWQSGEASRLLHKEIAFDGAVRLLHGQKDADVPWEYSLEAARKIRSDDVQVHLVKDGDHRLSRDQDIALLVDVVARLG